MYGDLPGNDRANQACTSGPVVETAKYGSPRVATRRTRMREMGSAPGSGLNARDGTMGSSAKAAHSMTA